MPAQCDVFHDQKWIKPIVEACRKGDRHAFSKATHAYWLAMDRSYDSTLKAVGIPVNDGKFPGYPTYCINQSRDRAKFTIIYFGEENCFKSK